MSLKDRVRKLEKRLVDTSHSHTDHNGVKFCRIDEAIEWVASTMSPEHREKVLEENKRYKNWWETSPLIRRGPVPSISHLTEIFNRFVTQAASVNFRPYALPTEVAEVYLNDSEAYPDHECERCGYKVPIRRLDSNGEVKRYFTQCPLCGGTTGEFLWGGRKSDLPYLMRTNSMLYKFRRMQYHERQIEKLLDDPEYKEYTRQQIIEYFSEHYPDIKKYVT